MITLDLSMEEANALAGLIDIAVKAGGIRNAAPALVIMQKLEEAAKAMQPSEQNKDKSND